jgi:hypothetical protein
VQISAYHDYELAETILDALKKSSKDNDINFGVHLCYYTDDIFIPSLSNVKYKTVQAPEGLGVGYGRYEANALYNGEDYYLQVDSHTRFVQNWDSLLIQVHSEYVAEGCKPIITSYPSNYWYEDHDGTISFDKPTPIQTIVFETKEPENDNSPFIKQKADVNELGNIFAKSVSGGSVFSSGDLANVAPNKKMFYWGEETLMAARFFTHGYDLMLPKEQTLFHLYFNPDKGNKNYRRHSWGDFTELSAKLTAESDNELKRIFDGKIIGDQELGSKRTLEEFEYYANVKFKRSS